MASSNSAWGSDGTVRKKLRARLRAEQRPCHLCGQPIDYSLPHDHPYSFSVDHIVPVARGGAVWDYDNLDAAHKCCNQRKGTGMPGDGGVVGALPVKRSRLF